MTTETHRTHATEHLHRLNDDALTEAGVHRTGYQAITHALLALTAPDITHIDATDECADVEQCDEFETIGQNCRAHTSRRYEDQPRAGWRTPTAHRYDVADAPVVCGSSTSTEPDADGKACTFECGRLDGHDGVHTDGPWVWLGERGHEFGLTHLNRDEAQRVLSGLVATPHLDARDPKRAARLAADTVVTPVQPQDTRNPAWRLGLLAERVRRAMNIEPLPVEMTVDALVDDLDENVRELIESRNNWRDEHQAQQPHVEQLVQITRELVAAADLMLNIGVRPAPGEFTALAETTQRVQAAIEAARRTLEVGQ
ncbi:hypothetical protein J1770_gp52 [Gordonia phage EMoore]|uniref:Uncharacterized protein n=1 Tax=Gordonia phage EMoore TaxID=2656534 RepID=A0A649VU67_9CAUD|nr:hypothetical protein J1770_gp52 [Gordonia phage EMoore]QGJ95838.1 hypothetical protein SEA_EMOORE_52 [Gordonia phage EMoore]